MDFMQSDSMVDVSTAFAQMDRLRMARGVRSGYFEALQAKPAAAGWVPSPARRLGVVEGGRKRHRKGARERVKPRLAKQSVIMYLT